MWEKSGLHLTEAFRDISASGVFSIHVARISVRAVSASSAEVTVLAYSAFALE
jgi:hypothetical protein